LAALSILDSISEIGLPIVRIPSLRTLPEAVFDLSANDKAAFIFPEFNCIAISLIKCESCFVAFLMERYLSKIR
jgi:hypothetical protein